MPTKDPKSTPIKATQGSLFGPLVVPPDGGPHNHGPEEGGFSLGGRYLVWWLRIYIHIYIYIHIGRYFDKYLNRTCRLGVHNVADLWTLPNLLFALHRCKKNWKQNSALLNSQPRGVPCTHG